MLIKKNELMSIMESIKTDSIKINDEFTKNGLIIAINAINESDDSLSDSHKQEMDRNSTYNLAALTAKSEPDEFYNIDNQDTEQKQGIDKKSRKKQNLNNDVTEQDVDTYLDNKADNEKTEEENIEDSKENQNYKETKEIPLTFDNRIGYPRILMDDGFKNMTEIKYQMISNIMNEDELNTIMNAKDTDWLPVTRRATLANLNQLIDSTKKKVACYDIDKQPTGKGIPRQFPIAYIKTFYENKKSGRLKDVSGPNEFALMQPNKIGKEKVDILQVRIKTGRNRYAIKFKTPESENPYLMIGSDLHTNFFYKK